MSRALALAAPPEPPAAAWPSTDERPRRAYARDQLVRVEALLAEVAGTGARCPTNREIATGLGITEEAAKTYVRRLAAAGRIRLVASATRVGRVVEIVASGARTAAIGPAPVLALVPVGPSPARLPVRRAAAAAAPAPATPALATPREKRAGAPQRGLAPGVRFACESIHDLPAHQRLDGCGWIEGDLPSGDWSYCNRAVEPGTAWCRHHYGRCYTPRPAGATP